MTFSNSNLTAIKISLTITAVISEKDKELYRHGNEEGRVVIDSRSKLFKLLPANFVIVCVEQIQFTN